MDSNEEKNEFRKKIEEVDKELEKLNKTSSNTALEEFRNSYNEILRDYMYNDLDEKKLEELIKKIELYKERGSNNETSNDNSKSLADILGTNLSNKTESKNDIQQADENNLQQVQSEINETSDDFEHFNIDQSKETLKNAIDDINKELVEKESEVDIDIDDIEIVRRPRFRRFLVSLVPTNVLIGAVSTVSKTQDTLEELKENAENVKSLVKQKRLRFVRDFKERIEEEQKEKEEKELEGMNRIKIRRSFGHVDLIYLSIILMLLLFVIGIMLAQ